ncbi:MAG: hypothetical protein ACKVPJ_13730 [Chitinophagales bacterium]
MKKILFLVFILSATHIAFSQTALSATIDKNFLITLPTDQPLSSVYQLDISALSFKDEQDCADFFHKMHEIVVNYKVNFEAKTVTILLSYDNRNEGWGLTEWNNYFQARSKKMMIVYNTSR